MKKYILPIAIVLLMSGCGTSKPTKSQAQYEQERISARVASSNMNTKTCVEEAKKDPQVQKFFNEIMYEVDTSPNKFTLLTNKEKINKDQIETLKDSILILNKCRQMRMTELAGLPYQNTLLKYYNAVDSVYIKMLKGEISIGEANEERVKAVAQQRTDWSNAWSEIDNRLRSLHNSEMEGRRQEAAAMMPLLMQQRQNQYNQQMQQDMLNQQQMNNIFNNLLAPPRNTNCTTFGNQTNCTTR